MNEEDKVMKNKSVMVTGATAGIGKRTALDLARMGATVLLVGRNESKGQNVMAEIRRETGNDKLDFFLVDLTSLTSIRELADKFKSRYSKLDVLVNNAGGIFDKRIETVDGFEMNFGFNHLAPFLLTHLLLDVIKASAPSRIIHVSSSAHTVGEIDVDDLNWKKRKYRMMKTYGASKLANILFTYESSKRLEGTSVTVNCLHPGGVRTNFGKNTKFKYLFTLFGLFMISPKKGAKTSIYLASSPEVEGVTGKYFVKCKPKKSSESSYDEELQKKIVGDQ